MYRSRSCSCAAVLFAFGLALVTATARAQQSDAQPGPPPPATPALPVLKWDVPRFRVGEAIATGMFAAAAFGSLGIPPSQGRWSGSNSFDDSVRNFLRFENEDGRLIARDASDVLLAAELNFLLIDDLAVTWWGHESSDVALQMALVDMEALAFTVGVDGLVAGFTSRARPYLRACTGPLELQNQDCRTDKRYRSFFSGHTSTSFAIAGLTCIHHAHFGLYGSKAADALACTSSFAAASAVGLMRIAADQHWATDVIAGAAFGTLSGLGIPWLFHYRSGLASPSGKQRVTFHFVPTGLGGTMAGEF